MTTPSPTASQYDAALAQNPNLTSDPSLAYPVVSSTQEPLLQTQASNSAMGQYYASYLNSLPVAEQSGAWANMSGFQQQLATAGGYTSALTNMNQERVSNPVNQAGKSWWSRIAGAIGTGVSDIGSGLGTALSALNYPLKETQRVANTGILGITDALEGNPISVQNAWSQAGSAPMTQDSLNMLTDRYGSDVMDLVRQVQEGKDPVAPIAAALKANPNDPNAQQNAANIENIYKSPAFKQALTEANNHLISPGRVTAGWVSDALNKATAGHVDLEKSGGIGSAFGILSGSVDALFDFNADPAMFGMKLLSEMRLARYGFKAAEGVDLGKLGAAAETGAEGAETGAEAGSVAGPEGSALGAAVGGAAGVIGSGLASLLNWGEKGGTTALAKKVAASVATRTGTDLSPISDAAGFQRRLENVFDSSTTAGQSVRRYFDGMGAHVSQIMNNPGTDMAASAMKSLRRDYPRFAPYLDAMVEQGVTDADKAKAFFNTAKGYEMLVQGSSVSRVPLMAYRSNLQQNYLQYIPRASTVFDWLENGHKLTAMPATDEDLKTLATQVSPEAREAAQAGQDFAEGSTVAQTGAASAQELAKTAASGNIPVMGAWRAKTATLMRRMGSKIPDFEGDQMDLGAVDSTQNFQRLVKLMAPSWYADRVGATFAAADIAGRKNIYKSVMSTLFDASGITKTDPDAVNKVLKAIDDSDVGAYSLGDVGRLTDGSRAAALLSQARPYVPAIPVKQIFAQGAKHGVFAHTVGFTNKEVIDKAVDNVWRPFVLLRPAFAFRSSIEEAMNHIWRLGMTDKLKGMLSRSALNEIELRLKNQATDHASGLSAEFNNFDNDLREAHGISQDPGVDVAKELAKRATSASDPDAVRELAQQWTEKKTAAQLAVSRADAMPGVFDADHSRLIRFLASPVTRGSQLTTAIYRKLPISLTVKGRGFVSTGAQIRDAMQAHDVEASAKAAQLKDARTNLSNTEQVFINKYGMTTSEAKAIAESGEKTPAVRQAKQRLTRHQGMVQDLQDDVRAKQLAVENHGDLPAHLDGLRNDWLKGDLDRATANLVHFMGRVGLAYLQKASPGDIEHLYDLAKSPLGEEIVNHEITELTNRTQRDSTLDMGPIGKRAPYKRVGLGPYKGIDPATQDGAGDVGAHAWSWSLDLLAQDQAARAAVLNADNPKAAIQAVKDVLASNPEYRKQLRVLATKSDDQYAAEMLDEVHRHLGIAGSESAAGPLNKELFNNLVYTDANGIKRINPDAYHPEALSQVPLTMRPHKVFGRDSFLQEDNSQGGFLTRLVQHGFSRTGSWISYMSRQDQYLREYVNMRNVMKPWEEMQRDHFLGSLKPEGLVVPEGLGATQVVDSKGIPLRVYHGTSDVIHSFDDARVAENHGRQFGAGHYFTTDPAEASGYARGLLPEESPNVRAASLDLRNVYDVEKVMPPKVLASIKAKTGVPVSGSWSDVTKSLRDSGMDQADYNQAINDSLRANGFDGIKGFDSGGHNHYVVFSGSSVKAPVYGSATHSAADVARATQVAKDMVTEHAVQAAWGRTLQFLDHPGVRSQAAVLMRNMAPFYRAQQGFLARWAKSFRYSPQMVMKMDMAANYVQKDGIVHKDADGNSYVTLPMSGALQWTLGKAGAAFGLDFSHIPVPTLAGNLLLSSPGFNVDFLKHPLTGPVVTLPLQTYGMLTHNSTISKLLPSADDILNGASGDQSVGKNPLIEMLPAVLRPLAQYVSDEVNGGGQSATFTSQAIAYLQATGHGLPANASPADKKAWLDRIQAHSLGLSLMEALIKPFDPMPLHNEAPIESAPIAMQKAGLQNVKNEFNQLVKDTGSYQMAYEYWVQAHPDTIPFLTSADESTTGASIPQTQEAFDWMNQNKDLLETYKEAAPYLIPQGDASGSSKFSYAPFQLAQQLGISSAIDNSQYLDKVQRVSSMQWYYNLEDQKKAAIAQTGGNTYAADQVRAQYAPYEQAFFAMHPDTYQYVQAGSVRDAQRTQVVQEMAQMLQDPRVDTTTPQAQSMQRFLSLYAQFQYNLSAITARGTAGTAQKASLAQQFDQVAQGYANQDATSAMLYNGLFRYMESTKVNQQAAMGTGVGF